MPVSYTQIEDPQEPSQTVYPALPMQSVGAVSTIPTPLEVQDNLSILHRHPNFFVLVTSDPDDQPMSPHVCNDAPQEEERNGEVKSEIQPLAPKVVPEQEQRIAFSTTRMMPQVSAIN